MTVLVTGGAGYIGSHMAHQLNDAREAVVVLDDLSTGFASALPQGVRFIHGDIADKALVADIVRRENVRDVVHFAARIVVPDSVARPLDYYYANVAKTRCLIEAAVDNGVERFVFSSTAAVYGDVGEDPVDERADLSPINPYGRTKLMSEWILEDTAAAHTLRYAVLRYFNVAGADPKGRTGQSSADATHLIKVAVQTALGVRPGMQVYGNDYPTPDGSCIRDYIHVSDLIHAHVDALTYLREGGESFKANCGYGRGLSVFEVIDAVERVAGVKLNVTVGPRRPGDPARIVAKSDYIRDLVGWSPRHDNLDEIIRSALDWEKHLMSSR